MPNHTDKEILDAIVAKCERIDRTEAEGYSARGVVAEIIDLYADMTREETEVEGMQRRIKALREGLRQYRTEHAIAVLEADDAEIKRRNKNST